jgi:OPA family glycerol-3-phosphate transporter-like MFS transporter
MNLLSDINIHLENKKVSRVFFAFIWLMYALVYMTKSCFSGALASIVAEGSLTLTETSIISAGFYIAYTPLQILGGVFADKYSPEKLIAVGLLGSAASNVVIFFNQSFWVMLAAWVFSAIIQFALWPAVYKIMSSQLVRSDRSRMIFFMSFASSGGLILTYVISAFLPNWRWNFAISAVTLVILTVILLVFCKLLNPILKKDKPPKVVEELDPNDNPALHMSPMKIFAISGFVALLPAVLVRTMVEQGAKTLSPTMLSQSYESISPTLGNLLNVLIIVAGVGGTFLLKFLIFPRFIKNELVCYLVLLGITLPFSLVLRFVGDLPVGVIVFALCMSSLFLSATHLLTQYFNMHFVKYGLNGTAAGILNAAASFGLVMNYCVFGPTAERLGWPTVTTLWIIMIVIGMIGVAFGIKPSIKFIKNLQKHTEAQEKK